MTPSRFGLDGRVAVVTGAASGIGRACAVALAEAGAAAVMVADVDEAGLAETVSLAGGSSGRAVVAQPTDVSDERAVEALVAAATEEHGRIDVMVNVAGIMVAAPLSDLAEADLDRVLAVNLKGVLFGTRAAAARMAAGGGGSIVNMASSGVDLPAPGLGAYAMSKAAVVMLTRTAALEWGPTGVRVNAVAPGYVPTAMTERRFRNDDGTVDEAAREAYVKMMASVAPLRRTGEPSDIADAVVYLASDAARFMTGQILRPNGGVTMPW